jgi:hypothetical protein
MWLNQAPVITVTGKAFFDVGHSFKDQKSNRRSHLPGYAAWEIHPVMALRVDQAHARVLAIKFCKASDALSRTRELFRSTACRGGCLHTSCIACVATWLLLFRIRRPASQIAPECELAGWRQNAPPRCHWRFLVALQFL